MFSFNKIKVFSIIATVFILTPAVVSAGVYFMESIDEDAKEIAVTKPCILDYPKRSCPDGKVPQRLCPSDSRFFQDCGCNTDVYKYDTSSCTGNKTLGGNTCDGKYSSCTCASKYQYTSSNCPQPKTLSGNACDGKYESCTCNTEYSKTCSSPMIGGETACDGKYKSCKCPTNYVTCDYGGDVGATKCTEENETVKYSSCKTPTCEDNSFVSSIPANQTCTPVAYANLSCYKDCRALTCEDNNFVSSCPSGQTGTPVIYANLSCYKDCVAIDLCEALIAKVQETDEGGTVNVSGAVVCKNKTITLKKAQKLVASSGASITFEIDDMSRAGVVASNASTIEGLKIYYRSNQKVKSTWQPDTSSYKSDDYGAIKIPNGSLGVILKNIDIDYVINPKGSNTAENTGLNAGIIVDGDTVEVEFAGKVNITDSGAAAVMKLDQYGLEVLDESNLSNTNLHNNALSMAYSNNVKMILRNDAQLNISTNGYSNYSIEGGSWYLYDYAKVNINSNSITNMNVYIKKLETHNNSQFNVTQTRWSNNACYSTGGQTSFSFFDNSSANFKAVINNQKQVTYFISSGNNCPFNINDQAKLNIYFKIANRTSVSVLGSVPIVINGLDAQLNVKVVSTNDTGESYQVLKTLGHKTTLTKGTINLYGSGAGVELLKTNLTFSSGCSASTCPVNIYTQTNAMAFSNSTYSDTYITGTAGNAVKTNTALFTLTKSATEARSTDGQTLDSSYFSKNTGSRLTSVPSVFSSGIFSD